MSTTRILGTWTVTPYQVELRRSSHHGLSAKLSNPQGRVVRIKSLHIHCGASGTIPHSDIIQKIATLSHEKISVFVYPKDQPSEVWIFEATQTAGREIYSAKMLLKQEPPDFPKALGRLKTAHKLQSKKGDATEIKHAIVQVKRQCLILKWTTLSHQYLSESEASVFNETLERYEDNILESFQERLEVEKQFSPHHHLMSALVHEEKKEFLLAMEDYLSLATKNPFSQACIEKAYASLEKACKQQEDLIIRKEGVRMAFERSLSALGSSQETSPTCFVCFNVEENDVGRWLEETLVPDMNCAGIKPIFCFQDLSPGQDLDNFQELARSANLVVVACTPDLKMKYERRKKAPIGVAQEIRMIKGRYNDEDKAHTIFPIFLKGSRKESLPTAYFEPIFGTKFSPFKNDSFEINYFSNAFDLIFAMRGISRKEARKTRRDFLHAAKKILRGNVNVEEIALWKASKTERTLSLRDSIVQQISTSTQMVNLPLPPSHFTGREKELLALHDACQRHHYVAITGLGGIGKTSLALKYGDLYKAHYQFVHFMPAGTPQLIVEGLLKLAEDLHIPKSDQPSERLQWLKTALKRFEREYLLIFDGIDLKESFDEATKYLPDRGYCLLLTSRMPHQAQLNGFELIELNPFSTEEAANYLLTITRSQDHEGAQQLADKLGHLPLALTHAARFIISQNYSIQTYILLFDKFKFELFENTRIDLKENETPIFTTWQISIDAIRQKPNGLLATEVLDFFAFLGQAPIPLDLVHVWRQVCHPNITDLDLGDTLKHLLEYSLISRPQADAYGIHPILRGVIQRQVLHEKQHTLFGQSVETLLAVLKNFNKDDPKTWTQPKLCIPHATTLAEMPLMDAVVDIDKRWLFLETLGILLCIYGNNRQALLLLQKSLDVALVLGEKHPHVAVSYNIIGTVYQKLGDNSKALKCFDTALMIWLQDGENHPHVASVYNNIGIAYQNIENNSKALEFHLEALNIRLSILGKYHSDVAISFNNIGGVHSKLGDNNKALEFHEKALKIRLQLFGENHPDVALSYNNIGSAHYNLGNYGEALEFHQKALNPQLQAFGSNHPDVARSFNNIGSVHQKLGNHNQALQFYKKALQIWLQIFEESHPDVAFSYNNIGSVYSDLGDNSQALEFYQKALKVELQIYGENHSNVAGRYNNIGLIYQQLGDYRKALEFYQSALKIFIHTLGENHPYVAKCYSNIGNIYQNLGKNEQALRFYQKALKIQIQVFGKNHPDVATSYNNIGITYLNLGNIGNSLEYYQKSLKIRLQVFGENHPDVASNYNNIGGIYSNLGDYRQNLNYQETALRIRLQVFGEKHPDVARSCNNIGSAYFNLKDYHQALIYYTKASEIQLQVLRKNHPEVARNYNNIGTTYQQLRDYDQALKFLQDALNIWLGVFGEHHPDVATSYNNIGSVYQDLGNNDKALELFQKALTMRLKLFGEKHPEIAASYSNIATVYYRLSNYRKALEFLQKALAIWRNFYSDTHPHIITCLKNIKDIKGLSHARNHFRNMGHS